MNGTIMYIKTTEDKKEKQDNHLKKCWKTGINSFIC